MTAGQERGGCCMRAADRERQSNAPRKRVNQPPPARAFDIETFLTTAGPNRNVATYKRKSYIFRQGSPCAGVFYVSKGRVELSVVSKQGKERVVGILGPGAFVG